MTPLPSQAPAPAPVPDRSYFVVFNPNASRGRAAARRAEIEAAFRSADVRFHLVETTHRGHAGDLAVQAIDEGWGAVVAVGGDGVIHEVANGLLGRDDTRPTVPVGLIPIGSGNDFIKMLGLPAHQPAEAVRRIVTSEPRQVDVGRVSTHEMGGGPEGVWYFTNGVGVGFDAQVAQHASRIHRLRGFAIYAWAVIKTLSSLRSPSIRVTVDGKVIADQPLIVTTVSNGPCHGGNFWLCPGAELDDGQLDILIADARSLPSLLGLLPRVIFGKHLGQRGVELRRGARIEVVSQERLPIHADGEIVAEWASRLEIEVLPGRLTVLG